MNRTAIILLLIAGWPISGCGPSAGEQALRSPEVRQRLLESRQRQEAEQERRMQEYQEIKNSTDAALRAAERLRQATEAAKAAATGDPSTNNDPTNPPVNRDPTGSAEPKPSVPTDAKKTPNPTDAKTPTATETPTATKTPAATRTPADAKTPAAWAQLRAGMSTAAVTALLGPPTATSQDRALLYWHYGAGASAGRIAFLNGSGQLLAWQPPAR